MPRKNVVKNFLPNTYYHVYNRGSNKQPIFVNEKDYFVFRKIIRTILEKNATAGIKAFALMKNHFHLLVFQKDSNTLTHIMRCILTRYVLYFNRKYDREGPLFSGSYRAILLPSTRAIHHVQKYILNNPVSAGLENWKHVGCSI